MMKNIQLKFKSIVLVIALFLSALQISAQAIYADYETVIPAGVEVFGNCAYSELSNPDKTGLNTSDNVALFTTGTDQWDGLYWDFTGKIDFSTNKVFTMLVKSSKAGSVILKLEEINNASMYVQVSVAYSGSGEWEELSFDFSTQNPQNDTYGRMVVFMDAGSTSASSDWYFDNIQGPEAKVVEQEPDNTVWELVWSDEFDTDGAINSDKWFHQTQLPAGGNWYNNEKQHYTDELANSFVENGILKIVAKKETYTDQGYTKQYTSARLNSKYAFTYGKVEVKAKLPSGVGTWPAIWTLGKNINEDGAFWDLEGYGTTNWPACGEIDIMEHWGTNQNFVQSATHTPSSYGATENHGGQSISTVSSQFHIYTLVWTPEELIFRVDNNTHYTYKPSVRDDNTWPYIAEQYILLNIAIASDIDQNFTQSAMEIDYVRIYQEGNSTGIKDFKSNENVFNLYPNPVNDVLNINFMEENFKEKAEIKLFSIDGKLLQQLTTNSRENELNISDLVSGVYFVKVKTNNKFYSEKIIKQ